MLLSILLNNQENLGHVNKQWLT